MLVLCLVKRTLSPRQRVILALVARNLSKREIARELGISPSTVDSHLRRVYARLGVHSEIQAVLVALQRGELLLAELIAA